MMEKYFYLILIAEELDLWKHTHCTLAWIFFVKGWLLTYHTTEWLSAYGDKSSGFFLEFINGYSGYLSMTDTCSYIYYLFKWWNIKVIKKTLSIPGKQLEFWPNKR